MFRVTKEVHFCYGHRLLNYAGKCRNLHGHNGKAVITVETESLDALGMVVDFTEIKRVIGPRRLGDSAELISDNRKILSTLPWRPQHDDLDKIVRDALAWERKLADFRKRNIGFIFQSFNLVDELSVRENIELALLYHNVPSGERRTRVDEVMDKVGIAHRAKHRPSQLSGGQQQRVAVARALVASPKLILADEPTGNLDTAHGEEVMKMLQALNVKGSTICMVTHSPSHADYAGRVVNMLDGRILVEHRRAA